jgi:heme/copper-type cytochrome/quinol oxidase subunit 1
MRKYFLKKYIYTVNHKRLALNYFFLSMVTGLSGAILATMIRLELAHPGSPFFKGDSLRYLQVITAHGLIMVFYVVVPIIFGGFANFLIPYHVGSKDVAYPRLNSIGFWIQPLGFILISKIAFLRPQFWHYYDRPSIFIPFVDKDLQKANYLNPFFKFIDVKYIYSYLNGSNFIKCDFRKKLLDMREHLNLLDKKDGSFINSMYLLIDDFLWDQSNINRLLQHSFKIRRKKIFLTKCADHTATVSGWAFVTPFSSNVRFTGVGTQDILIVSVLLAGISTTISFTNLLITRRTLAMSGMRNRKILLPFISISLFLTMRMLSVVTPVLGAAMIMLLCDRHWQTTFFEFVYGGDVVLFQHLFWFFGHPEVYILIIPTFGFINMIIPNNNKRRVASKGHLVWAIYIMAYMGFFVWGHHMYLVGLDHRSRSLYSTITIMISLPATVKLVNWTLSLLNGGLYLTIPILFSIAYILVFVVGGFTGMWLSHVGLNISMHDTFYVIAHFHLMLSGAVMTGCFAGFYHYFNFFFGIKYSRNFALLHFVYYVGGQWLTFLPMFWLGFSGLPRRVHDYPIIFAGWHGMATVGHFITLVGILFFFLMLMDSYFEQRACIASNLSVPRFYNRASYYAFKIRCLQKVNVENLNTLNKVSITKVINSELEYEFVKLTIN